MKNHLKIVSLTLIVLVTACKETHESSEHATTQEATEISNSNPLSSPAANVDLKSNRKFVRTADVKFKVKNVAKSSYAIENATSKFGGFVTYTNLESSVNEEIKTKISPDSTLVITKFQVVNNITIRIPNTKLDTVLKVISEQIHFLNYRLIKADDVSLQIISNEMAQKRSTTAEKRLENTIDSKGTKLKEIETA